MKKEHVVFEWDESKTSGRGRLVLTEAESLMGIRLERRGDDVFFVTPDSRVVAAFVRLDVSPATA